MAEAVRILNAVWATAIVMCLLAGASIALGVVMFTAATAEGQPRVWALAAMFCVLFVITSFLLAFTFNIGRDVWVVMVSK